MSTRRTQLLVGLSVALLAALAALALGAKILEVLLDDRVEQLQSNPQGQALVLGLVSALLLTLAGVWLVVHAKKPIEERQHDEGKRNREA